MQRETPKSVPWRLILLASFGGALEFYDFLVFGVFAPSIGAAFFPAADPLLSQSMVFAGFAVGYFARPVGGLVLSHFGDRFGRRRVFLGSVFVVSAATLAMGLLPTYSSVGIAAPVLLLGLRLIQGFCFGGELPGAITYLVETVPSHASFVCGVLFAVINSGVLVAALVNLVVQSTLPADLLPGLGWRIGFLFGGCLGLLGFWLRRAMMETPAFEAMRSHVARVPLREVVGGQPWSVVVAIAVISVSAGFNGLLFAFLPGYLRRLGYDPVLAAWAHNAGIVALTTGVLCSAWLGDHVPRRGLLAGGALALLLGCWPFFSAVATHALPLVPLVMVGGLVAGLPGGTWGAMVADLYPTRIRFSGVALSANISFAAFGGTTPLVATTLIKATGADAAPALVLVVTSVLALLGCVWVARHGGRLGT
jgi:MFS family permease